jgi:hypothetical protein
MAKPTAIEDLHKLADKSSSLSPNVYPARLCVFWLGNTMRCEAEQTARKTGRCQMRVVAPGERFCRFHHPDYHDQTIADLERRKAAYWARKRAEKAIDAPPISRGCIRTKPRRKDEPAGS